MSADCLLEIHREFTDKEKLDWLVKDYGKLENDYKSAIGHNKSLLKKVKELEAKIKEDENLYPSTIDGKEFVKAKTHHKLQKRHKELDKRFWELVHEMKAEKL